MTPAQREAWDAYQKSGTIRAAARELDQAYSGVRRKIEAAQKWLEAPEGQKAATEAAGLDIGTAKHGWRVIPRDDGGRDSVFWKAEGAGPDPESIIDAIREGLADLPRAAPVARPDGGAGMAALFPVADLHLGLLTDIEEAGEDWNAKRAREVFAKTFGRLVSVTPAADVAVLAQLGDLTHTDDQRNVTPQSGHQLDVDSRFFMTLRRAVATMKWAIEELRARYPRVIYRGCRGNHDLTVHHAVTLALSEHYEGVSGVEIIACAAEFYIFEHGFNMVLMHHGDRAKPDRLVTFAAAQWPEIWGRTRHRLALSGHVHHETKKEIGGMVFESVGTIIPRDAYAVAQGYTANRALCSMTLDADQGRISQAWVPACL